MSKNYSRLLVDNDISRREFIAGVTGLGVSVAGANSMAAALSDQPDPATGSTAKIEPGKLVRDRTGGELVIDFMAEWDVPYLFGLAGSEEVGLLDALVDHDVKFATAVHENCAMAMADGYSRSTGKTSIVSLHSVAGAAYALGQVVTSFRDRVPVVICAGRQSSNFRGADGFLEAPNLHDLPRDYARWTWDVMDPATIPEVLRRAFLLAEAPPGGPTFVTFSKDMYEKKVPKVEILPRSRSRVDYDVAPPKRHVNAIVDALENASAPLIFLGNETIRWEISEEIAGIAEATGAAVALSNKIPVTFPNTHPNFIGADPLDKELLATLDFFWSVGAPMFLHGNRSPEPYISRSVRTFHTGLDEEQVARNYPVDSAALADIKATAAAVLRELKARGTRNSTKWIEGLASKRRSGIEAIEKRTWNDTPIAPTRLGRELDRIIGENAFVVNEMATSDAVVTNQIRFDHSKPYAERRRNFDATGGVLGWGVAAAIGVKIGNPDKEVWCLTADGCLNFGMQSLWSAARYEVPLPIVVFNNGHYQANRYNFSRYNGNMNRTNRYIGVNLGHPDIGYVDLARGYGIDGERVTDPADIAPALQRARDAMFEGRAYLVDVKIATQGTGADMDYYDFFSVAAQQKLHAG